MNNSVNYSGFMEMFENSSDDFEPYGYSVLDADDTELQIAQQLNFNNMYEIE